MPPNCHPESAFSAPLLPPSWFRPPYLFSRGKVFMTQRTSVCHLLRFGSWNDFDKEDLDDPSVRERVHPIPQCLDGTHGCTPWFGCAWEAPPWGQPRCSGGTSQTHAFCHTLSAGALSGWRSQPPAPETEPCDFCGEARAAVLDPLAFI